jgi:hypothetical protein
VKTSLHIIQKGTIIIMLLIGPFAFINPARAYSKKLHQQEKVQQEMWSDQSNLLVDHNSEIGKQKNTKDIKSSEDIKTLLTVFLSFIGIVVICFCGNVLGEVVEKRIYSSMAGN